MPLTPAHRAAIVAASPRILVVLCLLLQACALPALEPRVPSQAHPQTTLQGSALDDATVKLTASHPGLTGILPLADAREAFAARMLLARSAERTLDVQYYIWHLDITGTLLLEALHDAADRGVRVRLLLDDNGIRGMDGVLAAMDQHPHIEVRLFNPFSIRKPKALGFLTHFSRANRRMHNKSFTVDQRVTIVGGRNIGDEYFGASDGTLFSDLDVMAVGPVAQDTAEDFDRYWSSASAYPVSRLGLRPSVDGLRSLSDAADQAEQDSRATQYLNALHNLGLDRYSDFRDFHFEWAHTRMISDDPAKGLGQADDSDLLITKLVDVIGGASESFDLVSPYFVPTAAGTEALGALVRQGVRVRVLTNALEATDVAAVHAGYAKRRRDLLRAGVELYETQHRPGEPLERHRSAGPFGSSGSSLHAKTFAVDGERVFVGSFNFDPRSARLNTELGFLIESPVLAGAINQAFDERIPLGAYEVRLEGRDLNWVERGDDGEIRHVQEPGAGFWRRLGVRVLSWMPIEWLL